MKKIALLGTSADPPTFGHQLLLEGLLTLFPNVVTWASNNPMKKHIASLNQREDLLQALVQTIGDSNLSFVKEISSPWAITTLEKAAKLWPSADFTFVVGSDLTQQIPQWVNVREVLKSARIGIAPRQGWPLKKSELNTLKSLGAQIEFLPLTIPATASSSLRKDPEPQNIPPSILPILIKQSLYGFNSN